MEKKTLQKTIEDVRNGHRLYTKEEVLELLSNIEKPTTILFSEDAKKELLTRIDIMRTNFEDTIRMHDFDFRFDIDSDGQVSVEVQNETELVDSFKDRVEEVIDEMYLNFQKNEVPNL